jgi:hypothetical protein
VFSEVTPLSFYRLSLRHYALLAGLFALLYSWVLIDQIFLPEVYQRLLALGVLALGLLTALFFIVGPPEPWKLSRHLSLLIGSATVLLTLVQHVLIRFDLTPRSLLILVIAFGWPFLAGLVYRISRRRGC